MCNCVLRNITSADDPSSIRFEVTFFNAVGSDYTKQIETRIKKAVFKINPAKRVLSTRFLEVETGNLANLSNSINAP